MSALSATIGRFSRGPIFIRTCCISLLAALW